MSQKQNSRIWKVNGLQFELDLEDADIFERTMKAFDELEEEQKALSKVGPTPDFLRKYCEVHYRMYDKIFGEGTGYKIFGRKHNARICDETSDDFIEFMSRSVREANQKRYERTNKYKPNRGQRRNNKNGNYSVVQGKKR